MTREIKFRGKRLANQQWEIGVATYVNSAGMHVIRKASGVEINIDPDTIGQYVECKDRNGKEIYEGDVLKVTRHGYRDEMYRTTVYAFGQISDGEANPNFTLIGDADDCEFEVVGTVFDNPELLRQSLNTSEPTC